MLWEAETNFIISGHEKGLSASALRKTSCLLTCNFRNIFETIIYARPWRSNESYCFQLMHDL